jgi:hypothetical protein
MESGAKGGARLTQKTYRLGVIGNDGLWPVGDDYQTGIDPRNLTFGKYSRDEGGTTAQDGKGYGDGAGITSGTAKKAIKTAYEWTGIYGASTLAAGGSLLWLCLKYPLDDLSWLKGGLLGAGIGSLYKTAKKIEGRYKERRVEKQRVDNELKTLKSEYFGLLKDIMKSGLGIDDRINLKYYVGVDQFNKRLAENKKKLRERADHARKLRYELDCMETYVGRYMEELEKTGMNDKAKYTSGVSGEAHVCEVSL